MDDYQFIFREFFFPVPKWKQKKRVYHIVCQKDNQKQSH